MSLYLQGAVGGLKTSGITSFAAGLPVECACGKRALPIFLPWPEDFTCLDFMSLVVQCGEGGNLPHNKTRQWQPSLPCLRQKCNSNIFAVPKWPFILLLLILTLRHTLLSLFLRQWNWRLINVHVVLLSPSHHAQTFLWMTVTVPSGYMLETPKFTAPHIFFLFA